MRQPAERSEHAAPSDGSAIDLDGTPPRLHAERVIARIARALGEETAEAHGTIARIVWRLGERRALEALERALAIEVAGGERVGDGSRRRTPGGIYFRLVRDGLRPVEAWRIFVAAPASPRAATMAEVLDGVREAPNAGEVRAVKITLIGRPNDVEVRDGWVGFVLHGAQAPAVPRGVPPPEAAAAAFLVVAARRQWNRVEGPLHDPEDMVIVEGYPSLDPRFEGITVHASRLTTRAAQRASRAAHDR